MTNLKEWEVSPSAAPSTKEVMISDVKASWEIIKDQVKMMSGPTYQDE